MTDLLMVLGNTPETSAPKLDFFSNLTNVLNTGAGLTNNILNLNDKAKERDYNLELAKYNATEQARKQELIEKAATNSSYKDAINAVNGKDTTKKDYTPWVVAGVAGAIGIGGLIYALVK